MRPVLTTIGLLILSNVFMTFAWYGHLKNLSNRAWYIAAAASWGVAFFEYMLQVPGQPDRSHDAFARTAQDHAGSHRTFGLRAVFDLLHEGDAVVELSLCGDLHRGRRLLHFPGVRMTVAPHTLSSPPAGFPDV